jgi:hypothetical protein
VRDVRHGHARYVARVVRLGEGTRQSYKGNAQALGQRSDGAANGSPTKWRPPRQWPSHRPPNKNVESLSGVLRAQLGEGWKYIKTDEE